MNLLSLYYFSSAAAPAGPLDRFRVLKETLSRTPPCSIPIYESVRDGIRAVHLNSTQRRQGPFVVRNLFPDTPNSSKDKQRDLEVEFQIGKILDQYGHMPDHYLMNLHESDDEESIEESQEQSNRVKTRYELMKTYCAIKQPCLAHCLSSKCAAPMIVGVRVSE